MEKMKDWHLYEYGKKYNNSIRCINGANYYDLVDTLIDFFNGNQWRNLEVTGMRKPVFNIVQKAIRFWVASITANNTKIDLEPLEYNKDEPTEDMNIADFASAEIMNLFEKFNMDNRIRDALFKAGTIGDVAAHLYFDPTKKPYRGALGEVEGEICFELINGTNVFFGNANNPHVETQPYIIVSGRDMVDNLKEQAKQYKDKDSDEKGVQEDKNYQYEAGSEAEIEVDVDGYGKATYVLVYKRDKKTGTIKVSKCVETAYIFKDVDTGLEHYPIAWLPWEKQESTYRGKPPCAEILETQIFINLMFAMIMFHLAMTAFPKAIYNADVIQGWSNEIAQAIPVKGMQPGDNIKNLAGYLEPGQMSNQITQVIDLAFNYTKDVLGINEAALGEINPEQASGKAIMATIRQSSIPLENTRANMYEWIENIGKISLDMMGTYYGERPISMEKNGTRTMESFDFGQLKNMFLNVKVDVGTTNVWSDIGRKQTLENLFMAEKIDMIQYLERMNDSDIPDRQGLIDDIKGSMEDKEFIFEQMARYLEGLDPEIRQQLEQLEPEQMEQEVKKMMMEQQAPQPPPMEEGGMMIG